MIKVCDMPAGQNTCGLYSVKCEGIDVPVAYARVSAMPYNTEWPGQQRPIEQTEDSGFVRIRSDGKIDVVVAYSDGRTPNEVLIRPLSKGISVQVSDGECRFTLPGAGQYSVEADGWHNALLIFVDPIKDFSADGKVIRFGPGEHDAGMLWVESDTTVIIDGGAVVHGCIGAINARNVRICGYGIIDGSHEKRTDDNKLLPYDYEKPIPKDRDAFLDFLKQNRVLNGCVRLYGCEDCSVEGITMRDSATFALITANCKNISINNVKTIGMWRYNSDGIDLFNCSDVRITDCFLRDFDDCIVIKGICGWDSEDNRDITVEGCVVWCDWGRALEIGAETNAPEYKNIVFRNCDLIHGSTAYMDIQHHNRADIHDIVFENIRAEYTKHQLSDVYQHNMDLPYENTIPTHYPYLCWTPIFRMGLFSKDGLNGRTHDIVFRNIQVLTDGDVPIPVNCCMGLDEEHTVERVLFENFSFDGKTIRFPISTNQFCKDIEVI